MCWSSSAALVCSIANWSSDRQRHAHPRLCAERPPVRGGGLRRPVISQWWPGIETFFRVGEEILVAEDGDSVIRLLTETTPERRAAIGAAARRAVLARHTADHRAAEFESILDRVTRSATRAA
jgi:hypothetical protein